MKRKIISAFLTVCMVFTLLPAAAMAAGDLHPASSRNIHAQDYFNCSKPVNSYLFENQTGGLTRVEYSGNKRIVIEDYDSSFKLKETHSVDFELEKWGGFFAGDKYNFFIFGQVNQNEDDTVEVI